MSILVQGSTAYIANGEFNPKVTRCLDLLKNKAPQFHTWLSTYNLTVRAAARSGANFQDNAIDIARTTFDASDTWLASVIVHETIHFWQYRGGTYQAGQVAEQEANSFQMTVLRLIGAPASEITYMMSQTGGHADLNGDGVYDWRDYQARSY